MDEYLDLDTDAQCARDEEEARRLIASNHCAHPPGDPERDECDCCKDDCEFCNGCAQ